jgi:acyl-CoA thioesterase
MSDSDTLAAAVVARMLARDEYSKWLGVELIEVKAQRAVIRMTVREEMVNGFGVAHGGIVFGLADSAFAFACNSNGEIAVAVDCTVSFPAAVRNGDVLTATAIEETSTNRLGFTEVTVVNQFGTTVGHFRGTAYRTQKPLPA